MITNFTDQAEFNKYANQNTELIVKSQIIPKTSIQRKIMVACIVMLFVIIVVLGFVAYMLNVNVSEIASQSNNLPNFDPSGLLPPNYYANQMMATATAQMNFTIIGIIFIAIFIILFLYILKTERIMIASQQGLNFNRGFPKTLNWNEVKSATADKNGNITIFLTGKKSLLVNRIFIDAGNVNGETLQYLNFRISNTAR